MFKLKTHIQRWCKFSLESFFLIYIYLYFTKFKHPCGQCDNMDPLILKLKRHKETYLMKMFESIVSSSPCNQCDDAQPALKKLNNHKERWYKFSIYTLNHTERNSIFFSNPCDQCDNLPSLLIRLKRHKERELIFTHQ